MIDRRVFVDTNVFVYLRDARDPSKQKAAAEWVGHLWETRTGRVSEQVLNEYYVAVTRELDPGLDVDRARQDVLALRSWLPPAMDLRLIERAWDEQDRWGFSHWDSLVVAAARTQACTILLTEDLCHEQDLDGLRVIDPFRVRPGGQAISESSSRG